MVGQMPRGMNFDDIEFAQEAAKGMDLSDEEYESLLADLSDYDDVRWEYVIKVDYEKDNTRQSRSHAVFFDIRVSKPDGSRANNDELRQLAGGIKMGEVPEGWEFRTIAWGRGTREDDPDRYGDEGDLSALSPTIPQNLKPSEIGEERIEE
jgi:hypothetical protein